MNRNIILKDNLTKLLDKFEINQKQLAYEIGISEMSISNWLNGRSYPNTPSLIKIADYFGVALDSLTQQTDTPDYELQSILSVLSPTDKRKVINFVKNCL
ncbi:helix-turn-helix transcriptional regulator [Macrococcoides bohemicum]|uniref:helix-turn-helix transcriptional regulator n=1 Tax=Macrococcoides bohemicum TaxID=1903056 RepID=UPI00165E16D3|nr:helix-turn-helix transcriptional regulator [Macrococcus bohemicus]MBC9875599.1 helix-turn-helix transcriptional regulator [Macrococcus bohemicus]QYA46090.1 helix-turn-helix domain-containing protein [Macrococcus bohemicus]